MMTDKPMNDNKTSDKITEQKKKKFPKEINKGGQGFGLLKSITNSYYSHHRISVSYFRT